MDKNENTAYSNKIVEASNYVPPQSIQDDSDAIIMSLVEAQSEAIKYQNKEITDLKNLVNKSIIDCKSSVIALFFLSIILFILNILLTLAKT